jgi:hypothetical protein
VKSIYTRVSIIACNIVMGIILLAGIIKLLDLYSFKLSLEQWTVLPPQLRHVATYSVPSFEFFVAGLWLVNVGRRLAFFSVFGLLVSFVIATILQMTFGKMPDCGCFGMVERWIAFTNENYGTLLRSGLLTVSLALAYVASPHACTK